MAWDEYFLSGMKSGAEMALEKWKMKQAKDDKKLEMDKFLAENNLSPVDPMADSVNPSDVYNLGGQMYKKNTPDISLPEGWGQTGISVDEKGNQRATYGETQDVKDKRRQKLANMPKGISADKAGLYELAKESVRNIASVKSSLFPTGEAKSYQRLKAGSSNLPMNTFPVLGALVPSYKPFNKDAQDIFRRMSAALSGRQLIQTGVAARPEETAKLVSQFAPNFFTNPEATLSGLNELEQFYSNYIKTLETKGVSQEDEATGLNTSFSNLWED
jgi:hypothetical protein